jgi:hypothetical protein
MIDSQTQDGDEFIELYLSQGCQSPMFNKRHASMCCALFDVDRLLDPSMTVGTEAPPIDATVLSMVIAMRERLRFRTLLA